MRLHLEPAPGEARTLGDQLHGHVLDAIAGPTDERECLGEEHLAAGVGEARVGGAEARADVAEPRRGEQGVADGVEDGVAVAVPGKPA